MQRSGKHSVVVVIVVVIVVVVMVIDAEIVHGLRHGLDEVHAVETDATEVVPAAEEKKTKCKSRSDARWCGVAGARMR